MRMILCSTLCLHSTSEIGCEYCPNKLKIAAEDVITTTNPTLTLASGEKQNTRSLITFWQVNLSPHRHWIIVIVDPSFT